MAKQKKKTNAQVFFNLNFDKTIIKDYIISEVKNGDDRPNDEQIESLFTGLINRIVEECVPDLKKIYISPEFKYIQFKLVGLREEPAEHQIEIKVNEDSIDVVPKETA